MQFLDVMAPNNSFAILTELTNNSTEVQFHYVWDEPVEYLDFSKLSINDSCNIQCHLPGYYLQLLSF